eukprot:GSChrysophyteH1.ASY1.ANO1.546.1 assembled CDS
MPVLSTKSPAEKQDSSIRVVVRVKPTTPEDEELDKVARPLKRMSFSKESTNPNPILSKQLHNTLADTRNFVFDWVANPEATQDDVWKNVGLDIAKSTLQGFNGTVIAYGQTGSGKTHTIFGDHKTQNADLSTEGERLLANKPRSPALKYIWDYIYSEERQLRNFDVSVSMCEIYNERVFDLLDEAAAAAGGGAMTDHKPLLLQEPLYSPSDAEKVLANGLKNRHTAATLMNRASSRSHAIFVLKLDLTTECEGVRCCRSSKFTLVDLAGSERQKQTNASDARLREAGQINRSLSELGNVIHSLTASQSNSVHVQYRNSKLTYLLRDSLGGNSKTVMVAMVTQNENSIAETLTTLKFAQRAKKIKNVVRLNEQLVSGTVEALQKEIASLKRRIAESASISVPASTCVITELKTRALQVQLDHANKIIEERGKLSDQSNSDSPATIQAVSAVIRTELESELIKQQQIVTEMERRMRWVSDLQSRKQQTKDQQTCSTPGFNHGNSNGDISTHNNKSPILGQWVWCTQDEEKFNHNLLALFRDRLNGDHPLGYENPVDTECKMAELEKQLNETKESYANAQREIQRLESLIVDNREDYEKGRRESLQRHDLALQSLKEQIRVLTAENEHALASAGSSSEQFKDILALKDEEYKKCMSAKSEAETEVHEMKIIINELQKSLEHAQTAMAEEKREKEGLARAVKKLREQVDKAQSLEDDLASADGQIRNIQECCDSLIAEKAALDDLHREAEARGQELENTNNRLVAENEWARDEVDSLLVQAEALIADKDRLSMLLTAREAELHESLEMQNLLQGKLDYSQQTIASMKSNSSKEKEVELQLEQQKLSISNEFKTRIEELQNRIHALNSESANACKALKSSEDREDALREMTQSLSQQLSLAQMAKDSLTHELAHAQNISDNARNDTQEESHQRQMAEAKVSHLTRTLEHVQMQLTNKANSVESLRTAMNSSELHAEILAKENKEMTEEMASMSREIESFRKHVQQLQDERLRTSTAKRLQAKEFYLWKQANTPTSSPASAQDFQGKECISPSDHTNSYVRGVCSTPDSMVTPLSVKDRVTAEDGVSDIAEKLQQVYEYELKIQAKELSRRHRQDMAERLKEKNGVEARAALIADAAADAAKEVNSIAVPNTIGSANGIGKVPSPLKSSKGVHLGGNVNVYERIRPNDFNLTAKMFNSRGAVGSDGFGKLEKKLNELGKKKETRIRKTGFSDKGGKNASDDLSETSTVDTGTVNTRTDDLSWETRVDTSGVDASTDPNNSLEEPDFSSSRASATTIWAETNTLPPPPPPPLPSESSVLRNYSANCGSESERSMTPSRSVAAHTNYDAGSIGFTSLVSNDASVMSTATTPTVLKDDTNSASRTSNAALDTGSTSSAPVNTTVISAITESSQLHLSFSAEKNLNASPQNIKHENYQLDDVLLPALIASDTEDDDNDFDGVETDISISTCGTPISHANSPLMTNANTQSTKSDKVSSLPQGKIYSRISNHISFGGTHIKGDPEQNNRSSQHHLLSASLRSSTFLSKGEWKECYWVLEDQKLGSDGKIVSDVRENLARVLQIYRSKSDFKYNPNAASGKIKSISLRSFTDDVGMKSKVGTDECDESENTPPNISFRSPSNLIRPKSDIYAKHIKQKMFKGRTIYSFSLCESKLARTPLGGPLNPDKDQSKFLEEKVLVKFASTERDQVELLWRAVQEQKP